jgi:activator of HSP90 ATPase
MTEQIKLSANIPASPKQIYDAWLSRKEHSKMTGSKATTSIKVGGKFTAWDKYISGINLELIPGKRILQAWRTTEFSKDDLDSHLLIKFEEVKGGSKVTLIHSEIPKGQSASYKKGWSDFYLKPMKTYCTQ